MYASVYRAITQSIGCNYSDLLQRTTLDLHVLLLHVETLPFCGFPIRDSGLLEVDSQRFSK